jgi:hypothetical protein
MPNIANQSQGVFLVNYPQVIEIDTYSSSFCAVQCFDDHIDPSNKSVST